MPDPNRSAFSSLFLLPEELARQPEAELLLLWSRSFWFRFRIGYTQALLLQVDIAGRLMYLCRKPLCGQYSIKRNGNKVIFKISSSTEVLVKGILIEADVPGNVVFLGHGVVNSVLFSCRVTDEVASRRLVVEFLAAFVRYIYEGQATEYTQVL